MAAMALMGVMLGVLGWCAAGDDAFGQTSTPSQPTAEGSSPATWWRNDFETNRAQCAPNARPDWCAEWFAALDTRLRPFGDLSVPEWKTIPYARNQEICASRLPPDWCEAWMADAAMSVDDPDYRSAASAALRRQAAAAARVAREAAERLERERPMREASARIAAGAQTPDDIAFIRSKADSGDLAAMEILAWMHTQRGRGVPRDYVAAMVLYGQLLSSGQTHVCANAFQVWSQLTGLQKQQITERFGENAWNCPQPR